MALPPPRFRILPIPLSPRSSRFFGPCSPTPNHTPPRLLAALHPPPHPHPFRLQSDDDDLLLSDDEGADMLLAGGPAPAPEPNGRTVVFVKPEPRIKQEARVKQEPRVRTTALDVDNSAPPMLPRLAIPVRQ